MNLGDFEGDVRLFDQLIRSVHASTAIYEVWPRRDLRQDPQVVGVRYHAIASQLQAELVPVGPAWMQALAAHPNLRLYQDDDHHARPEGTYLAACVFYAALLRQSPEGLPVSVPLDANTARDLQRVAWDVTR
jgi:hypothetical protein